jgi:uncharacterized protein
MIIPKFPDFVPIELELKSELHPGLSLLKEGISEFTFAGLYLFRNQYGYQIARLPDDHLVISGKGDKGTFFMLPCGIPEEKEILKELFSNHDYLKNLPQQEAEAKRIELEKQDYCVCEDRENFDYLYLRKNLVQLAGRKYHKKRNLVNAFLNSYSYEEMWINRDNEKDAFQVLERWMDGREDKSDYDAALEALSLREELELTGCITYVDGKPAAYSLGEALTKGKSFAVHFEKADDSYKGIYQFINRSFASMLPRHYCYINREQDLGDPGLRQAKMSYRPDDFVKKYKVHPEALPICTDTDSSAMDAD